MAAFFTEDLEGKMKVKEEDVEPKKRNGWDCCDHERRKSKKAAWGRWSLRVLPWSGAHRLKEPVQV